MTNSISTSHVLVDKAKAHAGEFNIRTFLDDYLCVGGIYLKKLFSLKNTDI
jgi:hypothetical protein